MANIGIRIRKLRELRNYSQDYMASQLNMSQQNYSKIESGTIKPNDDIMQKIASTLETEIETIQKFDDKIVFNISANTQSPLGNGNTISYQIDARLEKLYTDKIQMLEIENAGLKRELGKLNK